MSICFWEQDHEYVCRARTLAEMTLAPWSSLPKSKLKMERDVPPVVDSYPTRASFVPLAL